MRKRSIDSDEDDPEEPEGSAQREKSRHDSDFESFATEMELELYKEGDPRAMDRLFFRLRRMLLAVIRDHASFPFLPATHSAEDVLQELWTVIFERGSLQKFRSQGKGSLRAYLRRCVDNTMLSIIRRGNALKRGGGVSPDDLDRGDSSSFGSPQPEAPGPGPATVVAWDDWVSRCQRALHGKELEVWVLHFVKDLTYREIAAKLEMTEPAARSTYHRAIQRLKDSGMYENEGAGT